MIKRLGWVAGRKSERRVFDHVMGWYVTVERKRDVYKIERKERVRTKATQMTAHEVMKKKMGRFCVSSYEGSY